MTEIRIELMPCPTSEDFPARYCLPCTNSQHSAAKYLSPALQTSSQPYNHQVTAPPTPRYHPHIQIENFSKRVQGPVAPTSLLAGRSLVFRRRPSWLLEFPRSFSVRFAVVGGRQGLSSGFVVECPGTSSHPLLVLPGRWFDLTDSSRNGAFQWL